MTKMLREGDMKLKKGKSKQMKKVCNPFEKCDVGLDRPISMVELYITNRELRRC